MNISSCIRKSAYFPLFLQLLIYFSFKIFSLCCYLPLFRFLELCNALIEMQAGLFCFGLIEMWPRTAPWACCRHTHLHTCTHKQHQKYLYLFVLTLLSPVTSSNCCFCCCFPPFFLWLCTYALCSSLPLSVCLCSILSASFAIQISIRKYTAVIYIFHLYSQSRSASPSNAHLPCSLTLQICGSCCCGCDLLQFVNLLIAINVFHRYCICSCAEYLYINTCVIAVMGIFCNRKLNVDLGVFFMAYQRVRRLKAKEKLN